MIYKSFLDYGLWKSSGIDDIPNSPGVYIILARIPGEIRYEVYYIGSSSDLRRRLSGHEVLKGFGQTTKIRIHFLEIGNYKEYEVAMIQKYSPLANVHHQVSQ